MRRKLSELHCNVSVVSNRGEKVMKSRKIIGQICPIALLAFWTFSPRLENNQTSKCGSDSFQCMVTYTLCVKSCQNYILMLSPNCGETVLECMKISWTQDLRVQQMHSIITHAVSMMFLPATMLDTAIFCHSCSLKTWVTTEILSSRWLSCLEIMAGFPEVLNWGGFVTILEPALLCRRASCWAILSGN